MPAPPAAGGLLERPDQRSFCCAVARQTLRLVIGAADRVVADQPIASGQRRLQSGSSGKEGRGRGLGATDDRSGNRKKNKRDDRGDEHHTLELGGDRAVEGADAARRST